MNFHSKTNFRQKVIRIAKINRFFFSFFGNKEYGPYKIWKNDSKINQDTKEKKANTNTLPCAKLAKYKNEIKKAVIQNIYENISIRLNNSSTPPSSSKLKKKQPQIGDINKTQMYLNDCLKNSPFSDIVREKCTKTCSLSRNNSEDKRILSPSFESLPIMIEGPKSAKPISICRNEGLKGASRKKSRRSIILPPIENRWAQDANQFRSISATPRYSTLFSAKTIKMDSKLLSGRSRNLPHF